MGIFDFLRRRNSEERQQLDSAVKELQEAAFPLGESQILAEAGRLHDELRGRLTKDDCRMLVQRVKVVILLQEARDEAYLADYVYRQAGGKLSREEARLTYLFIEGMTRGHSVVGSGNTADDAVVIVAENTMAGIKAEYEWLQEHVGQRDRDWTLILQSHGERGGKMIETLRIKLMDGSEKNVYFDITGFYGKLL